MSRQDDWRISSPKELGLALVVLGFVFVFAVGPLGYVVHAAGRLLGLWGEAPPWHQILLSALFVPYLVYLWRDNAVVRLVFGVLAILGAAGAAGWGAWWLVRDPTAALPRIGRGLVWLACVVVVGLVALGLVALLTGRVRERRIRALAAAARKAPESERAERRGRKLTRTILALERPGYEDAVDACAELREAAREEGPLRADCLAVLARYATPDEELLRLITAHLRWGGWQETRQAWIRWAEERQAAGGDEEAWRATFREARLRLDRAPPSERRRVLEELRSTSAAPWQRLGGRFARAVAALPPEEKASLEGALVQWLEKRLDAAGGRSRALPGARRPLPG